MIRIGRIDYANCTPIFHLLEQEAPAGAYRFETGVPSRLNAMLADGSIDVCPSSSFEYARNADRYLILPGLSISSIGPVGSVLLFSRHPIQSLDGATILLSADSATSVNLLRVIMAQRFGFTCTYRQAGHNHLSALDGGDALLLIGDSALKSAGGAEGTHVYDMGQLWHEWTGLPFVFALWFCSRRAAERHPHEIAELSARLLVAKESSLSQLEHIADLSPEALWMGRERLLAYWREDLSYDLDERHLAGLRLFFRKSAELGLVPCEPELHFFGGDSDRT